MGKHGRRTDRNRQPDDDGQWQSGGAVGDTAVGLAAGALDLPSVATGLADMGTALGPGGLARAADEYLGDGEPGAIRKALDRPFSRAASAIGEATGVQPSEWADTLREERYSPQMQESQEDVETAWQDAGQEWDDGDYAGAVGSVAGSYLSNPRTIQSLVTESLPATVAGGLLGRGLMAAGGTRAAAPTINALAPAPATGAAQAGRVVASGQAARQGAQAASTIRQAPRINPAVAGGAGEGAVISGMTMSDIDEDVDPQRAALAALGAGVGGAALAAGGARLAGRAGLVDPESAIAGGGIRAGVNTQRAGQRGVVSRVAGGAAAEGVLQEMPQEALETISTNWAEGEPLLSNVPRAAVEGLMAGGVMGGAANIRRPRAAKTPTDLTRTVTSGDVEQEGREPGAPMDTSGADLQTMLRYHRRLARVAREATQHPDLQEQALERIQGVRAELERQGYPEEVVDLELAKNRYTELQLEEEQMQRQYEKAVTQNPAQAQRYLAKARERRQEIEGLEEAYGPDELTSPDLATIRTLQEMDGTENYFKSRNGERTNQLKGRARQRLEQYREMDEESLARQLAKDQDNADNGVELDTWVPLRVAAAEEKGITSAYVNQVRESDAGGQRTRTQQPQPNVATTEGITQEAFDEATSTFDDDGTPTTEQEVAATPQQQAEQYMRTGLTPAQSRVWASIQQAAIEAQEGRASGSIINRAADLDGTTRTNLEKTLRGIITGVGRASNSPSIRSMSPQKFIDSFLGQNIEVGGAPQATDSTVDAETQELMDRQSTEDVMANQEQGSPGIEILGAGGASIQSAGQSQSDTGTSSGDTPAQRRRAAEFERGLRDAEREQFAPVREEIKELKAQKKATNDRAQKRTIQASIDALTDQLPEAEAHRERLAQREQEAQEIETAAAQRREQLREEASRVVNSEEGRIIGAEWDALVTDGPSWTELVQSEPHTAVAWVRSVEDIVNNNPQGAWSDQITLLFSEFTQDINYGPSRAEPEQQDTGAAGPVGPEPSVTGAEPVTDTAEATPDESTPVEAAAEVEPEQDTAEADVDGPAQAEPGRGVESTRATSGTGPVVRTRGRGRRNQTQTLRPAEAATDDSIQDAIDASTDNPGDEGALEAAMAEVEADREQYTKERIGTNRTEQADAVMSTLETLMAGNVSVQQFFDMAQGLVADNPALSRIVETLRQHPSVQNVRILSDYPGRRFDNAYGLYYPSLHAIYINETAFAEMVAQLDVGGIHASARVDHKLAETMIHEMVHAASIRTMSESPNSPAMQELEALRQHILGNLDNELLTNEEFHALRFMSGDLAEMVTYAMTSPDAQNALEKLPSPPSAQSSGGAFRSLVQALMNLLGLNADSQNTLTEALRISGTILSSDSRLTGMRIRQYSNNPTNAMQSVIDNVSRDVQTANRFDLNISTYVSDVKASIEEYQQATREQDTEARAQAVDRAKRLSLAISEAINGFMKDSGLMAARPEPSPLMQAKASSEQQSFLNSIYDSAVGSAPKPVQNMLTDIKNRVKRFGLMSMFSSDFVDMVKAYLPQVETYYNTIFHRLSERNNMHVELQKIVEPVGNFTAAKRDQLNTFLRESTYKEAWGFQPTWVNEQVTVDPALSRQFEAMDADAQKVAMGMFEHAAAMNADIQRMLRADIETTYNEYIEKARSDKQREKREAEKERALQEHEARQISMKTAYLPLKRWGEWAVVHKSPRFRQAENRRDRAAMESMKSDPNHYRVIFAETEYQARQIRDEMSNEMGVEIEDPFPRQRFEQNNEVIPFDLMQRLKQEVSDSDSPQQKAVSSAIDKLYIEALAESSVRKSELRRLKVEGAGLDMVRAFIEHGQGLASLGSAIKINKETRRALQEMRKHAKDPKAGKERVQRMQALNEVLARHAQSLDFEPDPVTRKIMAGTSVWMLLTNPAYYLQNATQPFMLTYPVLSARFGTLKSMGYMRRAYGDIFKTERATKDGELIDPKLLTDPEEQGLFNRLQRLGLMDVGIAADLGSLADSQNRFIQQGNKAHRAMVHAVRKVEVYNRGVTALSGYRLMKQQLEAARERGENQHSDSRIAEEAKRYAQKIIQTTQGDYSGPNAPRLINKIPAGRLVTQFRKFQLIQIGLLARTFHQAFKGASPAEKAVGRRQLTYIMGMHGLIGGAMGLPAANIIGYALAKAFGDEDEPANAELLARRAIGDKDTADLLLKGIPARLGLDASQRLGMGLTFSILPFTDVDASRDGMLTVMGSLMGPTAGLLSQMADGVGQIQQGNVAAGTAQLLPSALRNGIRAYMYQTDGVRMRNGDLAMSPDELSWFDVGSQGIGWPSTGITDRYMVAGSLWEVQEHFRSRTSKLKRAYTQAFDVGDRESMDAVRQEWLRLQSMRREYGVGQPQSVSVLTKAPREQAERERGFMEGVPTTQTTRRFVESLFE